MRKVRLFLLILLLTELLPRAAVAQQDPVSGNWRGTIKSGQGPDSPIIISIAKSGAEYNGATTGLGEGGDTPIRKIVVNGTQVSIDVTAESKLGQVTIAAELTAEGNNMKGAGTLSVGAQQFPVTLTLIRRARAEVLQHQVEQRIEYFVGRWKFEYLGGEFPPLSAGGRSGTVTFSAANASTFATGKVEGEVFGKAFQETISLGVNPDTKAVVYQERRTDGVELLSVGDWRSPLAITFQTSPLAQAGKTYRLRRVMSVLSNTSFDVTEEFSVDGGAFRRLGNAHYTKLP